MALDEPDAAQATLGAEIRRRRRDLGLTLANLAAQADISHSFLSQLERGYARPSMTTLQRIAQALETTQVNLMLAASPPDVVHGTAAVPPGAHVVRADQGATLPRAGGQSGYARLLVGRDAAFYPQEQALSRRDYAEYYQHPQDEWVYVVTGAIEVDLGGNHVVVLHHGDSLYYAGGIPHRWRLVGTETARLIVVQQSS